MTYIRSNQPVDPNSAVPDGTTSAYFQKCGLGSLPGLPTSLRCLDLSYNPFSDVSPLKALKELENLDLQRTKVADLSVVQQLKALRRLNISFTEITDFSPVSRLTGLVELEINGCSITDCQFVRNLKNLKHLSLAGNKISNCDFLKLIPALITCNLAHNDITEFSLNWCGKNLQMLVLNGNRLTAKVIAEKTEKRGEYAGKITIDDKNVDVIAELLAKGGQVNGMLAKAQPEQKRRVGFS